MELFKSFDSGKSRMAAQKYFSLEKGIESYEKVYKTIIA